MDNVLLRTVDAVEDVLLNGTMCDDHEFASAL